MGVPRAWTASDFDSNNLKEPAGGAAGNYLQSNRLVQTAEALMGKRALAPHSAGTTAGDVVKGLSDAAHHPKDAAISVLKDIVHNPQDLVYGTLAAVGAAAVFPEAAAASAFAALAGEAAAVMTETAGSNAYNNRATTVADAATSAASVAVGAGFGHVMGKAFPHKVKLSAPDDLPNVGDEAPGDKPGPFTPHPHHVDAAVQLARGKVLEPKLREALKKAEAGLASAKKEYQATAKAHGDDSEEAVSKVEAVQRAKEARDAVAKMHAGIKEANTVNEDTLAPHPEFSVDAAAQDAIRELRSRGEEINPESIRSHIEASMNAHNVASTDHARSVAEAHKVAADIVADPAKYADYVASKAARDAQAEPRQNEEPAPTGEGGLGPARPHEQEPAPRSEKDVTPQPPMQVGSEPPTVNGLPPPKPDTFYAGPDGTTRNRPPGSPNTEEDLQRLIAERDARSAAAGRRYADQTTLSARAHNDAEAAAKADAEAEDSTKSPARKRVAKVAAAAAVLGAAGSAEAYTDSHDEGDGSSAVGNMMAITAAGMTLAALSPSARLAAARMGRYVSKVADDLARPVGKRIGGMSATSKAAAVAGVTAGLVYGYNVNNPGTSNKELAFAAGVAGIAAAMATSKLHAAGLLKVASNDHDVQSAVMAHDAFTQTWSYLADAQAKAAMRDADAEMVDGRALFAFESPKTYAALSPKAKRHVDLMREGYNKLGALAVEAGVFDTMLDHYVPHMFSVSGDVGKDQLRSLFDRVRAAKSAHAKQRELNITLARVSAGDVPGLSLRTHNAAEVYARYAQSMSQTIADHHLVQGLKAKGYFHDGATAPKNYVGIPHYLLRGVKVDPSIVPDLRMVMADPVRGSVLQHIFRGVAGFNSVGKAIDVAGSMMHLKSMGESTVLGAGTPLGAIKAAGEHLRQDGAVSEYVDNALRRGLTLGTRSVSGDFTPKALDNLAQRAVAYARASGHVVVEKSVLALHKAISIPENITFGTGYQQLKLGTYEHVKQLILAGHDEPPRPEDIASAEQQAAAFANSAVGGQNFVHNAYAAHTEMGKRFNAFMASPEGRVVASAVAFAPDWLLSTLIGPLRAMGLIHAPVALRQLHQAQFLRSYVMLGALGYLASSSMGGKWDASNPFTVTTDNFSFSLFKHANEPFAAVRKPLDFAMNKLAPAARDVAQVAGHRDKAGAIIDSVPQPFLIQQMEESYRKTGDVGAGLGAGLLSFIGVQVHTRGHR